MLKRKLSIKMAADIPDEGWCYGLIKYLRELEDITVQTKQGRSIANLYQVTYGIGEASSIQRYFESINEGSAFGEVIKAVNDGYIPDQIDDLEELLIGKEICLRIAHNKSKITGMVFANPVEYAAIDAFDEVASNVKCSTKDFDREWDKNLKFEFPSDLWESNIVSE